MAYDEGKARNEIGDLVSALVRIEALAVVPSRLPNNMVWVDGTCYKQDADPLILLAHIRRIATSGLALVGLDEE